MTQTPQVGVGVELPRAAPDATASASKSSVNGDTAPGPCLRPPMSQEGSRLARMETLMQLLIAAEGRSPHKEMRQQFFSLLAAH